IRVYNTFGVVYDFMGELDRSLEWHSRALALSRQTQDQQGIANGLYAVGQVHRQLAEHPQALAYFEDALALDEASGNQKNIAYSHMKVGATHASLGDDALARQHFDIAHAAFEKMDRTRDLHWAIANLAQLDLRQNEAERGFETLHQVLAMCLDRGWPNLAGNVRFALARYAANEQRHDQAIEHIDHIIGDGLARGAMSDVLAAYELAAEVYEEAGRPAEALRALRKHAETRDMLFDRRRTSVIAAMQGEAEFKRQSIALELAEKNRALVTLALEREQSRRLAGLSALLGLFVVAFLAYGRLNSHRQNRRLEREVATQTRTVVESHERLQQAYAAVDQASLTDPLTGLANRRFLDRHLGRDTHQASDAHSKDLVFFLVDLDHFKRINDRYGHAAGDTVLVAVSRLLEREFRASDYLVRWGGEEFLVVARFIDRREAPA
ncbi:MAG: tetratricopeptide repeat-containing diguanylate cyclase, partial [Pseudomonadota bacterium]